MPTVPLSRALKIKNRQVKTVNTLQEQISKYNSVVVGSSKPFDVPAKFAEYEAAVMRLAGIKAAIQRANAPIVGTIFEMAELRGMIAFLQRLETKAGKNVFGYQGELVDFEAALGASEVEAIQKRIEQRPDQLQDETDEFNATTQVELPD